MNRSRIITLAFGFFAAVGASGGALAEGDAGMGKAVFDGKCGFCHGVEPGVHKMGPSMAGIYGMKAGTTDFKNYMGLKEADFVWNDETLDGFIANPKEFLGGPTSMGTAMSDDQARANVIAYLKTLK